MILNIFFRFLSDETVHDVNVQTDTPIMSEDDNTTGCMDDAPSAVSKATHNSESSIGPHHPNDVANTDYPSEAYLRLELSFATINLPKSDDHDMPTIETSGDLVNPLPKLERIQHTSAEPLAVGLHAMTTIEPVQLQPEPVPIVAVDKASAPFRGPDLSGLELLSNSIEAFENNISIKQEPPDYVSDVRNNSWSNFESEPIQLSPPPQHLGGLNLLCALAEQRIQEEVLDGSILSNNEQQVGHRPKTLTLDNHHQEELKRSSSSDGSEVLESRNNPHHHMRNDKYDRISGKIRSKHTRKHRESRSLTSIADGNAMGNDVEKNEQNSVADGDTMDIQKHIVKSFNRVRASYNRPNFAYDNRRVIDVADHCDHDNSGTPHRWPTAEEVISAMDNDMRQRLTRMSKAVQKEKRKLKEIRELQPSMCTPSPQSVASSSSQSAYSQSRDSDRKIDIVERCNDIDTVAPLIVSTDCSPNIECARNRSQIDRVEPFAVTDPSIQNVGTPPTTIRMQRDESPSVPDSASELSLRHRSSHKSSRMRSSNHKSRCEHHKPLSNSKTTTTVENKTQKALSKRTATETVRQLDSRCLLDGKYLDAMAKSSLNSTRVLTSMGGLFYAGSLTAVQPPDIYAVTLDGERGNRPHILSREEILRDAVSTH